MSNILEQEMIAATAVEHASAEAVLQGADANRRSDPHSPGLAFYMAVDQSTTPTLQGPGEERPEGTKSKPVSAGFPISHVLSFGPEAKAAREECSTRLSEELGVPFSRILAALEAFGDNDVKTRQWFLSKQVQSFVLLCSNLCSG